MFVWDPLQGRYVSDFQPPRFFFGFVWTYPADEKPYVPKYDAFQNPDDPPELKICRPCREKDLIDQYVAFGVKESHLSLIHACDGNGCQGPTCDIVRTIEEMNRDWDLSDRIKTWPED